MAHKKPKLGFNPLGVKEPKVGVDPTSNLFRKPAWRINRIQMVDPYGWHGLDIQSVQTIKDKLAQFETMTWNEIFTVAKKRNHEIAVSDLRCPKAKRWMEEHMPDQSSLWTLRLSGLERIWGVFADGVYHIIFWDPEHLIYPVQH